MSDSATKLDMQRDEFRLSARDRTRRYLGGEFFLQKQITISVSEELANTYSGQVLVLVTANLLGRSCDDVSLMIPDVPLHPMLLQAGTKSLCERVHAEMRLANPFGNFLFLPLITGIPDYHLQIGRSNERGPIPDIVADGDGWLAYVGKSPSPITSHIGSNPIGPTVAACLALADIFKKFTGAPAAFRCDNRLISLFDFSIGETDHANPIIPNRINLGRAQQIGVGSVGSALIYLLGLVSSYGHLDLIDHQDVELVNLDRSPIFAANDAGQPKVLVGERWLINRPIEIRSFQMTYGEYVRRFGRGQENLDLVLLLANEENVYADVQNNYPPMIIYGTTTSGWGINLGRHIPLKEECIVCRYPTKPLPNLKCATTEIALPDQEVRVDASLPFLSMLAGTLAFAELVKAEMPGFPFTPNYAYLDIFGPLTRIEIFQRSKRRGCICADQNPRIYQEILRGSRWLGLSSDNV